MCLSTAYANTKSSETVMAKNVTTITFDGDEIILTDLMDSEIRVQGRLTYIDLVNATVIIDTEGR
ncbi:MAG: CooT family nickel-binding protein [Oscillospiraceae bacterium]|nr:CooT family nickel-binding protein [Oscillospiraceae bacterium]